jgi:hypothetical protein
MSCRLINESSRVEEMQSRQPRHKKSTWRCRSPLFTIHAVALTHRRGFYVKIMFKPNEPTSSLNKKRNEIKAAHRNERVVLRLCRNDTKAVRRLSTVTFWRLAPVVFSRKHLKRGERSEKKQDGRQSKKKKKREKPHITFERRSPSSERLDSSICFMFLV